MKTTKKPMRSGKMLENPQVRQKIVKEWRNLSPVRDIKIKIVSVHYIPKEKMRELNALRAEYWHEPITPWFRPMQMITTNHGVFFSTMEEHGGFNWETTIGKNVNATLKPSAGCWWIQKEEDAEEVNITPASGGGAERKKFTLTNPTNEQEEILSAFLKGESLKIHAFAGTGKTATLTYLASNTKKRGLYFAFNRRIAKEAGAKMPKNITSCTVHSVAFDWALSQYKKEKLIKRPAYKNFGAKGEIFNIPALLKTLFSAPGESGDSGKTARGVVRVVLGVIKEFCQSDDGEIKPEHFYRWLLEISPRYKEVVERNENFFLGEAAQVWERMKDPNEEIPLGHDGYLKLWSLSNPQLNCDFLFVDEGQDLNPVMLNILNCYTGQKIIVGDGQQQVYLWRGAVNAMNSQFNARELHLTKTFRFGEELAEIANNVLQFLGVERKIVSATNYGTKVVIEQEAWNIAPNAYLFRANMSLVERAFFLFKKKKNYYIADPNHQILSVVEDYFLLQDGFWGQSAIFMGYNSWADVVRDANKELAGTLFARWVGFLNANSPMQVLECVKSSATREGNTYPTLSTVHQAKGLEWDTVQLSDDLIINVNSDEKQENKENQNEENTQDKENKEGKEMQESQKEELRVLYVALTRAKRKLILSKELLNFCQSLPNKRKQAHPTPQERERG